MIIYINNKKKKNNNDNSNNNNSYNKNVNYEILKNVASKQ